MPVQAAELLRLQDLDSRIDALRREKAALDSGAALKEERDRAVAAAADAEARLHQLQAEQASAELELQSLEQKTATVRKKLYDGKVTIPKELTAMEHEIEMFGRQRGRLDERILTLMDDIQATQVELMRLVEDRENLVSRYDEHVAAL